LRNLAACTINFSESNVEYVMVPVPLELRSEVEHFLIMRDMALRTSQMALDADAVEQLFAELNATCTEVLAHGAAAALEDRYLSIRALAEIVDRPVYETFGIAQELCELVARAIGPKVSIVRTAPEASGGSTHVEARRLVVARGVASLFVETEKLRAR
jgi:hypothetical protein